MKQRVLIVNDGVRRVFPNLNMAWESIRLDFGPLSRAPRSVTGLWRAIEAAGLGDEVWCYGEREHPEAVAEAIVAGCSV